jgi:hypothetical protein
MANEPKSCIFCEATRKMSGEHVWGDWTKDFVERTSNKHNHANVFVPEPGEPEPALVRIRAGDPLDSKVHVVCEPCNNGWLSVIQNNAKDRLVPLFRGVPCILSVDDQTAIAMWVAMATMTGEYLSADRKRLAIPQSDRRWLMERKSVPSGWHIWAGRYERKNWPAQWVKAGFPIVNADELPTEISDEDKRPTMQTTAFTVGKLFVFAMSSEFPEIPAGWDWRTAPLARTKLVKLWPATVQSIGWPPEAMSDADADAFAGAVIFYFEDLAKRQRYR